MTTNDREISAHDALPDALRWRLRELRDDALPERDLWPDVAARVAAQPQLQPMARRGRRRDSRRLVWLATAASVAVAIGFGWQLRPASAPVPATPTPATASIADASDSMLVRQADAMAREYEAALRELEAARPAVLGTGALMQLDRSAAEVRAALDRDPDAAFLLERLQRVYARRLSLTQRLA